MVLAAAVVFAVCLQVYLIGAYIFGAEQGALDAHRTVGFTTHGIECLVLVTALVAWLPRTDVLLSLALVIVGTTQVALANAHRRPWPTPARGHAGARDRRDAGAAQSADKAIAAGRAKRR